MGHFNSKVITWDRVEGSTGGLNLEYHYQGHFGASGNFWLVSMRETFFFFFFIEAAFKKKLTLLTNLTLRLD